MAKFKLTVGADPEFFFAQGDSKEEKVVPACGLFGGSKRSPVFLSPEGGYLEDGCCVEFNIAPANSLAEARERVGRLILAFQGQFPKFKLYRGSSWNFNRSELRAHPQAMTIGCDPDYYAWGVRDRPQISNFKNCRFAGGHIHIGIDPWPESISKQLFVKYLDIALYAPFIGAIGDNNRFPHYGFPGLYREKDYGIEYRSPDNFWAQPQPPTPKGYVDKFIDRWDRYLGSFLAALGADEAGVSSRLSYLLDDTNSSFHSLVSGKKFRSTTFNYGSSHMRYGDELQSYVLR